MNLKKGLCNVDYCDYKLKKDFEQQSLSDVLGHIYQDTDLMSFVCKELTN